MRLFSNLAYYVKLIQDTITESSNFMLMVCIIICSFANFFYVININLPPDKSYYKFYYGKESRAADSIVSVYMLGALGSTAGLLLLPAALPLILLMPAVRAEAEGMRPPQ